jgi:hypothetical protein
MNIAVDHLNAEIAAVGHINAVPTILDVVCRTTGMGFAAVARVTKTAGLPALFETISVSG